MTTLIPSTIAFTDLMVGVANDLNLRVAPLCERKTAGAVLFFALTCEVLCEDA
jgi:hypothetical protein